VGLCDGVWRVSLGLGMPAVGLGGQTAIDCVCVWVGRGGAPPASRGALPYSISMTGGGFAGLRPH